MKVNRNRTFYYLKEGISSIFAHSLMSFASVCIIVAFLIIMGSFIMLAVNINSLIGELESENLVLAYVHENLSENDAIALEPILRATPNVSNVAFISREQAMSNFIGRSDDTDRFSDVDASWFRHRYAVYVTDVALITDTIQALRYIREIAAVNANTAIASGLVTFRNIVSWISIIIVAILLLISLFIMQNTIKLATYERREEIAIMKMVGATNSFIRWPFIVEGFILGLLAGLCAYFVQAAVYRSFDRIIAESIDIFTPVPFAELWMPVFIFFLAIGFLVGVFGSLMTIRKYLKV